MKFDPGIPDFTVSIGQPGDTFVITLFDDSLEVISRFLVSELASRFVGSPVNSASIAKLKGAVVRVLRVLINDGAIYDFLGRWYVDDDRLHDTVSSRFMEGWYEV
jgi:hypothetical protein